MTQCWAASLGGCEGKISREHLVSAALWKGPEILVVGMPWCKEEPKKVGVAAITSKILCRKHNSSLSDVDGAGATAFKNLEAAARLQAKRKEFRPRRWKVRRFAIDGKRLERWFLKTLINIVVHKETEGTWARSGTPLKKPPEDLVEAAFAVSPIEKPLGLYTAAAIGEDVVYRSGVEVRTLLNPAKILVGALFTFVGFRFFLYVDMEPLPRTANLPSRQGWIPSDLLYHLTRINFKVGGKLSHYVHVLWNL